MNRRVYATILTYTLSFVASMFLAVGCAAQASPQKRNDLPEGKWTLSILPTRHASQTVDVYSVLSEASKGLAATEVRIVNKTEKNVSGVKLSWRLSNLANEGETLLQGETPLLAVALAPQERRVVQYPVVTFAKIYQPLLKGGRLAGDFNIEIQVSDVVYEEARYSGSNSARFVKAAAAAKLKPLPMVKVPSHPAPPPTQIGKCQLQRCRWNSSNQCYDCTNDPCFNCK